MLLLATQLATSLRRYFVNDDYQVLYTAWLQSRGMLPGRDFFVASFSPLIDLLEPLFSWFPESFVPAYAGRFLILACLASCAWLVSRIAGELFGCNARIIAPIIFLSSAPVVHRGIDIRPDIISTLLTLLAVLLLVKYPRPVGRAAFLLGALVGIAVVNRFKAIVIVPGLASALLWTYWRHSAPVREKLLALTRMGALAAVGAALPILAYAVYLFHRGTLDVFVSANVLLFSDGESISSVTGGLRTKTMLTWLSADRALAGTLILSIVCAVTERRNADRWGPPVLALVVSSAILVLANSAFYAYNLVSLSAMLAPIASWPWARLLDAAGRALSRRAAAIAGIGVIAFFPLLQLNHILLYATTDSSAHQKALTQFLITNTPPDARVFAMEGVGLFRPSNFHWRMPEILRLPYESGRWSLSAEWIKHPPEIVVTSYRVPWWLTPDDRRFLRQHYVQLAPQIFVPGFHVDARSPELPLQNLSRGVFQVITNGECRLDSRVVINRQHLDMSPGPHHLSVIGGDCTLRRPYSREAIDGLANPKQLPYLFPPQMTSPSL